MHCCKIVFRTNFAWKFHFSEQLFLLLCFSKQILPFQASLDQIFFFPCCLQHYFKQIQLFPAHFGMNFGFLAVPSTFWSKILPFLAHFQWKLIWSTVSSYFFEVDFCFLSAFLEEFNHFHGPQLFLKWDLPFLEHFGVNFIFPINSRAIWTELCPFLLFPALLKVHFSFLKQILAFPSAPLDTFWRFFCF